MGYTLEGKLFEACSCSGACPCWDGHDPHGGQCDSLNVYHYDRGTIDGVDVSGLSLALVSRIPGNITQGNWNVVAYVDSNATPEQRSAILAAHTGQLGGPLADFAKLIGDMHDVYDVPIQFDVATGRTTVRVGEMLSAALESDTASHGPPLGQVETMFCTVPGSAHVGAAVDYRAHIPQHNMDWKFSGSNALLGEFRFDG